MGHDASPGDDGQADGRFAAIGATGRAAQVIDGTRISNEFRLLVLCCAWPRTDMGDDAVRAMAADKIDWAGFLALTVRHRVGAMVHAALSHARAGIPAAPARVLALEALRTEHQNRLSAAETGRLQRRLDAAAIPAVFFKGASLGQLLYGSLALRQSKDIDLLVAPENTTAVVALLEEDGYRLWLPMPRLTVRQWAAQLRLHKEVAMVSKERGLQVEPHWRLTYDPDWLNELKPTGKTTLVELFGMGSVRTFSRADLFAYLCVHGAEHGWRRLKWLADIHAILSRCSPSEIEDLYWRAGPPAGTVIVATAMHLCAAVFNLTLPPRVLANRSTALVNLSLAALLAPEDVLTWRMGTLLQLRIALLRGDLSQTIWHFFSRGQEAVVYPLPPALRVLHALARIPFGIWRQCRRRLVGNTASAAIRDHHDKSRHRADPT